MNSYPLLANLSTRSINYLTAWAYGYAVRNPQELSPKAWQELPYYYGPALFSYGEKIRSAIDPDTPKN